MKPFSIIVAVDAKGGIGKDGTIPWNCPEDRRFFFGETTRPLVPDRPCDYVNVLIMGRKTWQSLPRRLKQRVCLVVSRTLPQHSQEDAIVFPTFEEALENAGKIPDVGRIFVVGGAALYEEALQHPAATELVVSSIGGSYNCDTFFPKEVARRSGWGNVLAHSDPTTPLSIRRYRRSQPEISVALDALVEHEPHQTQSRDGGGNGSVGWWWWCKVAGALAIAATSIATAFLTHPHGRTIMFGNNLYRNDSDTEL